MNHEDAQGVSPSADELIELYGREAAVAPAPGIITTLGNVVDAEAEHCTAEDSRRLDPDLRRNYVVKILKLGGSLLPEHEYLVPEPPEESQ